MTWGGRGSTRRWRKVRAAVLARDHGICQIKGPGCLTVATQVHHILGTDAGDSPAVLQAACHVCNSRVGDPSKSTMRRTTQW